MLSYLSFIGCVAVAYSKHIHVTEGKYYPNEQHVSNSFSNDPQVELIQN